MIRRFALAASTERLPCEQGTASVFWIPRFQAKDTCVRYLTARLVMLMTTSIVVVALAQSSDPSAAIVLTGAAVLSIAAFYGARNATIAISWVTITIGARSRVHREVVSRIVAPRHPNTPGKPRTRAPSQSEALA